MTAHVEVVHAAQVATRADVEELPRLTCIFGDEDRARVAHRVAASVGVQVKSAQRERGIEMLRSCRVCPHQESECQRLSSGTT